MYSFICKTKLHRRHNTNVIANDNDLNEWDKVQLRNLWSQVFCFDLLANNILRVSVYRNVIRKESI